MVLSDYLSGYFTDYLKIVSVGHQQFYTVEILPPGHGPPTPMESEPAAAPCASYLGQYLFSGGQRLGQLLLSRRRMVTVTVVVDRKTQPESRPVLNVEA